MPVEWFRRTTWTIQDQEEFFARLKRSRGQSSKAQYLRIQACSLLAVKTVESVAASATLLKMLLDEYPEPGEIAIAYALLGECCEHQGQYDKALLCYRKSLEQQRSYPSALAPDAYLRLAMLVAERQMCAEYEDTLSILAEWGSLDDFPKMSFDICAAYAMIYLDQRQKSKAAEWACRALEFARKTHSGFRNHPTLGLAGDGSKELIRRMESIINA